MVKDEVIYIHYGSDAFDRDKFKTFDNEPDAFHHGGLNKPGNGVGLWACRTDCELNWKDWCENEDYEIHELKHSFKFTLIDNAKILTVRSNNDIEKFMKPLNERLSIFRWLNFKDIVDAGYDGLELIHGNHWRELHDGVFYTWDVDSIVVWNPDVIVERNH